MVALYDASTTTNSTTSTTSMMMLEMLPPMQPLLDLSRLVLPEKLPFCSVELFNNESERQPQQQQEAVVVVIPRERPREESTQQQQQSTIWPIASFDPDRSTEENYTAPRQQQHRHPHSKTNVPQLQSTTANKLVGRFAAVRRQLDYSYHRVYTAARQQLQDAILSGMLDKAKRSQILACRGVGHGSDGRRERWQESSHNHHNLVHHHHHHHHQQQHPRWAVFTAGVMGAGKTHTIEWLAQTNRFPLASFVWVDPDQIRQCLPEFEYLVRYDAAQAGDKTRKEAGMLSEILTLAALQEGQSVLVDGSLRDVDWYDNYFQQLRQKYPGIQIAILHVTAPREAVLERAAVRHFSFSLARLSHGTHRALQQMVMALAHVLVALALSFSFCHTEPRQNYRPCRSHFLVGKNNGPSSQICGSLENQG